jgi:hypothetical protein
MKTKRRAENHNQDEIRANSFRVRCNAEELRLLNLCVQHANGEGANQNTSTFVRGLIASYADANGVKLDVEVE